jgi:3-hydroxybutyryl-CoA dehydrogenase
MVPVPEQAIPGRKASSVWVAPDAPALKELVGKLGAKIDAGAKPGADSLCMVAPLGKDATTAALELGLDATRTVAVDPLFGFAKRRTLMTTPATSPEMRDAAHGLLASDGVPVSRISDSAGFVAQRVVAHVVNVGCDIVQMRIATPEDLDRAVTLGLGYPRGPLAMGDALGPKRILAVLEAMHATYQEPRYRPSPWLRRRAALGVSLLTPE